MAKAVPSVSPKIYGKKVFTKQIKSKAIKETQIIFLIICFVVSDIFIFITSVFKFNSTLRKIIPKRMIASELIFYVQQKYFFENKKNPLIQIRFNGFFYFKLQKLDFNLMFDLPLDFLTVALNYYYLIDCYCR